MQDRSYKVEFLLCVFGGIFGFHKFYERKYAQGVLYLFTMGLFIFGWLIDLIKLYKPAFVYDEVELEKYNEYLIQSNNEREIQKQKQEIEKQAKKQNKINKKIGCPRCGSTDIEVVTDSFGNLKGDGKQGILSGKSKERGYFVTSTYRICRLCGKKMK